MTLIFLKPTTSSQRHLKKINKKQLFSTNNYDYKALEGPTTLKEKISLFLTFFSFEELQIELLAHNRPISANETKMCLINALSSILAVKQECVKITYRNFVLKKLDLLENSAGELNVTLLFWHDWEALSILLERERKDVKIQLQNYKSDFLGHLYLPTALVIHLISFSNNTELYHLLLKTYCFKDMLRLR